MKFPRLPWVPMGIQAVEIAAKREQHPLPDEPCTSDCRDCVVVGYCLNDANQPKEK